MYKNVIIIAEVKTKSPFGFNNSSKSWDELFKIANEVGDIISIHTDPRWGGSFDLVRKARGLTKKPILAKGIHKDDADIDRAIDAGADYVLVVGRLPSIHQEKLLIEPITLQEMEHLPLTTKVVWNSRDLDTGFPKDETFADARKLWKGWLCQASFVKTVKDIEEGATAVIVGSQLEQFANSLT